MTKDNREDKFLAAGIFVFLICMSIYTPDHDTRIFMQGCSTTFIGVVSVLLRGQSNAAQQSTISDSKVTQVVNQEVPKVP